MRRRVGVALGIATVATFALPAQAGAESYVMDCQIAGTIPTQLDAMVTAGAPASPVEGGESFTLPQLYVEFDPSIDAEFTDGTLTILGQQVALGTATTDGPDRAFWGPTDVELTAPTEGGTFDIAPEALSVVWQTPDAGLPISCDFPAGAPAVASIEVVIEPEPPGTTPTTTPGNPPATTPPTTQPGAGGDGDADEDDGDGGAVPVAPPAIPVEGEPNFTG
jgi:hypothetical protein